MRRVFISAEHQSLFERQGYVIVPFLRPAAIDDLRQLYERAGPRAAGGFHATLMSTDVAYRKLIHDAVQSAFAGTLGEVLADYRVAVGNFFVKRAGDASSEVFLHQD